MEPPPGCSQQPPASASSAPSRNSFRLSQRLSQLSQHSHSFIQAHGYFIPVPCAICGRRVWSGVVGTSHPAFRCACGLVVHGQCSTELAKPLVAAQALSQALEAEPPIHAPTPVSVPPQPLAVTPPPPVAHGDAAADVSPTSTPSPVETPPADVACDSWMWVRDGNKWDRGFVVLRRQVLTWMDLTRRGSLPLSRIRAVESCNGILTPAGYSLTLALDGGTVFSSRAMSLSSLATWESLFSAVARDVTDSPEASLDRHRAVGWLRIPNTAETPSPQLDNCDKPQTKFKPRFVIVAGGKVTWYTIAERMRLPLEAGCACCPTTVVSESPQVFTVTSGRISLLLQADSEAGAARWISRVRAAITPFVGVAPVQPRDDDSEMESPPPPSGGCPAAPALQNHKKVRLSYALMLMQESLNTDASSFQMMAPSVPLPFPATRKFFILSLDGGGCRGVIAQILLTRLQVEFPDLLDRVDLLAGTSAGGLSALALARGHSPKLVREFEELMFREAFKDRRPLRAWGLRARFRNGVSHYLIESLFKNTRLGHLRKRVVVPAILLDNNASYPNLRRSDTRFYNNLGGPGDTSDERASDVAMRTMSAPTFVPSYQGCIDGALFANNPCQIAITHAVSPQILGVPADSVVCLSLGTGQPPLAYWEGDRHDWGLLQWACVLPTIVVDAAARTAEQLGRLMIGDRFWQIDPLLPSRLPVDDASNFHIINELAANIDLGPTVAFLRQNVYS